MNAPPEAPAPHDPNVTVLHVVYALMALGFITGLTWIAAVIVCYVKRDDLQGTYLASHVSWNIRTFWWTLLWGVIGGLLTLVLVGIGVLFVLFCWTVYRIVKGWLRLNERREIS